MANYKLVSLSCAACFTVRAKITLNYHVYGITRDGFDASGLRNLLAKVFLPGLVHSVR
jgi:hypothetical protein